MRVILYILSAFCFLSALGSLSVSILYAIFMGILGVVILTYANQLGNVKSEQKDTELLEDEIQVSDVVVDSSTRLVEVINESLVVASNSHNADTKLSRLQVVKDKIEELKKLSSEYPYINIIPLDKAEREIQKLEYEFLQAGYEQAVEGNIGGQALEKEGKFDEAIKEYESLLEFAVDTPHTYRRLAILYKKRKDQANEIRVLEAAIKNVPSSNSKHYSWFAERLAKRVS